MTRALCAWSRAVETPIDPCAILPGWRESAVELPLDELAAELAYARLDASRVAAAVRSDPRHYHREVLVRTPRLELVLATWLPGQASPIHDHGASEGVTRLLDGMLEEGLFTADGELARSLSVRVHFAGTVFLERQETVHRVVNCGPGRAVSLHLYRPPFLKMRVYEPAGV